MKCPVCKTPDLLMTERQSIEIDYCPNCRGVWLDRGELDKLVVQADDAPLARAETRSRDDDMQDRRARPSYDSERRHDERQRGDYRHEQGGYRKKRSLFDMFDFD
jgi:Zn-finger nucleic acid-binding protein